MLALLLAALAGSSVAGGRPLLNETSAALFLKRLDDAQCSNHAALVFTAANTVGLGARVSAVAAGLVDAHMRGRSLVYSTTDNWRYSTPGCAARNMDCFFRPIGRNRTAAASSDERYDHKRWLDTTLRDTSLGYRLDAQYFALTDPGVFAVTAHHAGGGLRGQSTLCWTAALLVRHVMRPNARLEASIEAGRAKLALPSSYLAMHVRTEDGITKRREAHLYTFAKYYEVAKALYPTPGRHVLLCTDSSHIRAMLLATDGSADEYRHFHWHALTWNDGDPWHASSSALVDASIAAGAAEFIGTFSSCFSRLILLLGLGRTGELMQFATLDDQWDYKAGGGWSSLCRQEELLLMAAALHRRPLVKFAGAWVSSERDCRELQAHNHASCVPLPTDRRSIDAKLCRAWVKEHGVQTGSDGFALETWGTLPKRLRYEWYRKSCAWLNRHPGRVGVF